MSQNVRSGSRRPRNPGAVSAVLQGILYDEFVKYLLHFDGTDESTTFTDETGKVWTRSGNAKLDSEFSRFGTTAAFFDGTGDAITTAHHTDLDFGTGDFTIDFWMRTYTPVGVFKRILGKVNAAMDLTSLGVFVQRATQLQAGFYTGSTGKSITGTREIKQYVWYHVALVRNGNTMKLYVDGVLDGSVDVTGAAVNYASSGFSVGRIGDYIDAANDYNGFVDELRISKGVARWTAEFIPQHYPYGSNNPITDPNLTSLLHFAGINTATDMFDTAGGSMWQPFGSANISTGQSKFGGSSLRVDGVNGTFVKTIGPSASNFTFGTGDFTVDFWYRPSALPGSGLIQILYDHRHASQVGHLPVIYISDNARLVYYTNGDNRIIATTVLALNQWYHIALVRSSGVTKLYLNGTQEGSSYTDASDYTVGTGRPILGAAGNTDGTTSVAEGWIDEFRVSKGIARWTSNFTPPTAEY